MQRVLVCGSRDYTDYTKIKTVLCKLPTDTIIVNGGARGADRMAKACAEQLGLKTETYYADWEKYGKKAGYLRNKEMIESVVSGVPITLVIAFHIKNSVGTQHTIDLATAKGILVETHH